MLKNITRIEYKRDPEKGEKGSRGAVPRVRDYENDIEWQAGEEGDEFMDWAFYNGQYYRCLETHTPTGDMNPFDEIGHGYTTWELDSSFQFLATKVMFAGEGANGWIIDKGVIYHSTGKASFEAGGDMVWGDNFRLSIDGVLNALAGVFSGRLQLKFQTITNTHTLTVDDSSSIWLQGVMSSAVLTLPQSDDFDGWMLNVFCYPRISKMDGDVYVSGKIWCPSKTSGSAGALSLYYASELYLSKGGFIQLMYSLNAHCWVLINDLTAGIEFTEYQE